MYAIIQFIKRKYLSFYIAPRGFVREGRNAILFEFLVRRGGGNFKSSVVFVILLLYASIRKGFFFFIIINKLKN